MQLKFRKLSPRNFPLGFTMMEIMIVIVIIGILAVIALPNFTGQKDKQYEKEAKANLKLIMAAEKIYRMEIGGFTPPLADESAINSMLKLSLPTGTHNTWQYSVNSDAVASCSVDAWKNTGTFNSSGWSMSNADTDPHAVGRSATQ